MDSDHVSDNMLGLVAMVCTVLYCTYVRYLWCVCVFIFLPCLPPLRQNLNLHRVLVYTAPSLTEW